MLTILRNLTGRGLGSWKVGFSATSILTLPKTPFFAGHMSHLSEMPTIRPSGTSQLEISERLPYRTRSGYFYITDEWFTIHSARHGCSERAQVVQNENSELKVATAHPPLKCRYRRNHNASFTKTTGIR
jgi:hypothetical protein